MSSCQNASYDGTAPDGSASHVISAPTEAHDQLKRREFRRYDDAVT